MWTMACAHRSFFKNGWTGRRWHSSASPLLVSCHHRGEDANREKKVHRTTGTARVTFSSLSLSPFVRSLEIGTEQKMLSSRVIWNRRHEQVSCATDRTEGRERNRAIVSSYTLLVERKKMKAYLIRPHRQQTKQQLELLVLYKDWSHSYVFCPPT